MEIKQFDTIILKNGKEAVVMEAYTPQGPFDVDIGDNPKNWDTITITIDDIEKKLND